MATVFQNYLVETEVSNTYESFIDKLILRRQSLKLSQEALAERIGCTASLVHKWEQYKRVPSGFMLTCWLDALGCTTIEIRFDD